MNGPTRIRKRPETAEAYRFDGFNGRTIAAWVGPAAEWNEFDGLVIHTDRGDVTASVGDWVIHGLVGEFYPCTPAAFEAGWEIVGEG